MLHEVLDALEAAVGTNFGNDLVLIDAHYRATELEYHAVASETLSSEPRS